MYLMHKVSVSNIGIQAVTIIAIVNHELSTESTPQNDLPKLCFSVGLYILVNNIQGIHYF